MSLRFQKSDEDEVEWQVKKDRVSASWCIFIFVFFAAVFRLGAWISGESLKSYERELGELIAFLFVVWMISPFYQEFRIRAKEIHGKVSAIEAAVNTAAEKHTELLERFSALEDKLDAMQRELESRIESTR